MVVLKSNTDGDAVENLCRLRWLWLVAVDSKVEYKRYKGPTSDKGNFTVHVDASRWVPQRDINWQGICLLFPRQTASDQR